MNKHINKNRKQKRERQTIFGGTIDTLSIDRIARDENLFPLLNQNGRIINRRTMAKKALKAYIKGIPFYTYKGEMFVVPRISKQTSEENENS